MADSDTQMAASGDLSFDLERFLSDLEHDLERAGELIPEVATQLPGHLLSLRTAVGDDEFERVAIYAHRLASLFRTCWPRPPRTLPGDCKPRANGA